MFDIGVGVETANDAITRRVRIKTIGLLFQDREKVKPRVAPGKGFAGKKKLVRKPLQDDAAIFDIAPVTHLFMGVTRRIVGVGKRRAERGQYGSIGGSGLLLG